MNVARPTLTVGPLLRGIEKLNAKSVAKSSNKNLYHENAICDETMFESSVILRYLFSTESLQEIDRYPLPYMQEQQQVVVEVGH